jgi:cell division protein FtsB
VSTERLRNPTENSYPSILIFEMDTLRREVKQEFESIHKSQEKLKQEIAKLSQNR